jgi:hypothetical protein
MASASKAGKSFRYDAVKAAVTLSADYFCRRADGVRPPDMFDWFVFLRDILMDPGNPVPKEKRGRR